MPRTDSTRPGGLAVGPTRRRWWHWGSGSRNSRPSWAGCRAATEAPAPGQVGRSRRRPGDPSSRERGDGPEGQGGRPWRAAGPVRGGATTQGSKAKHDRLAKQHGPQHAKVQEVREQIARLKGDANEASADPRQAQAAALLKSIEQGLKSVEGMRAEVEQRFQHDLAESSKFRWAARRVQSAQQFRAAAHPCSKHWWPPAKSWSPPSRGCVKPWVVC